MLGNEIDDAFELERLIEVAYDVAQGARFACAAPLAFEEAGIAYRE